MRILLVSLAWLGIVLGSLNAAEASVIFVNSQAQAPGDGQSWSTAYKFLQDALTAARNSGGTVTEIWVAAGTYYPDRSAANPTGSRDRSATFLLVPGVAIRGGFVGNEDSATFNLADRDLRANQTILSGDLAENDSLADLSIYDNSYLVVSGDGSGPTAVLDGCVIQKASYAGVYNKNGSSGHFINCTFRLNHWRAFENMYASTSVLSHCIFKENRGNYIFFTNGSESVSLNNCAFIHNSGTALLVIGSYDTLTVTNSIIWGNTTSEIYGTASITYSCMQGGWQGAGNISSDPMLITDGRLRRGSPCIDAGNNAALPTGITVDFAGGPRVLDAPETPDTGVPSEPAGPVVDMGPFEYATVSEERLYVREQAAPGGDGSNWLVAFQHLQDALLAAEERPGVTEIWVAQGTYKPDSRAAHPTATGDRSATFLLPSGIKLYGGFPGQPGQEYDFSRRNPQQYPTILSGDLAGDDGPDFANRADNSINVVRCLGLGPTSRLDGFTVTGGNADGSTGWFDGGGLIAQGCNNTVIANCTFSGNRSQTYGGALTSYQGTLAVANCRFLDNTSKMGGAAYLASPGSCFLNCLFKSNRSTYGDGGAIISELGGTLLNCTLVANSAPAGYAGGLSTYAGTSVLTNCIVWGNTPIQIAGPATVTYSCIQAGYTGTGNISSDPFLTPESKISALSPCIDAGDSTALAADVLTDIDGRPRFVDDPSKADTGVPGSPPRWVIDMGAFERQTFPHGRLYVNASLEEGGDGQSWMTAFKHLQDALSAVRNSGAASEIWVASGTYKPDETLASPDGTGDRAATFKLLDSLRLYGGFPGLPGQEDNFEVRSPRFYPTILSGDLAGNDGPNFANNAENSFHVVTASETTSLTVLDGFTVTAGNANSTSTNQGSGLYATNASPTLNQCVFIGHAAMGAGGALFLSNSASQITNCMFLENSADSGAGIYYSADIYSNTAPTLLNCVFLNNAAVRYGAAIYGALTVRNCTFLGNSGCSVVRTPRTAIANLTNCVIWGNSPTCGTVAAGTVTYTCIQGGHTGTGNINVDPLFVNAAEGNLRLRVGSPCIDAGNNAAVPSGVFTDLLGLPRFLDHADTPDCPYAPGTCGTAPIVDMGAHEFAIIPGDLDDDLDVDAADFEAFMDCASGPGLVYAAECAVADIDGDQDVDSSDFGILQRCYSVPGHVANPSCGM